MSGVLLVFSIWKYVALYSCVALEHPSIAMKGPPIVAVQGLKVGWHLQMGLLPWRYSPRLQTFPPPDNLCTVNYKCTNVAVEVPMGLMPFSYRSECHVATLVDLKMPLVNLKLN